MRRVRWARLIRGVVTVGILASTPWYHGMDPVQAAVTRAVTAVSASVAPRYSTACPALFTFSAFITVNSAGVVRYQWQRSDGAIAPINSLAFRGPGTQRVTTTWYLGAPGMVYAGWERVAILVPNAGVSNQAFFRLACTAPTTAAAGKAEVPGGTFLKVRYLPQPPILSAAQLKILQARTYGEVDRTGPVGPITVAPFDTKRGQPIVSPQSLGLASRRLASLSHSPARGPLNLTIFRDSTLPGPSVKGSLTSATFTQEPSTAVYGKNIFQTGNWYAARSFDNGLTWQFLDPFAIFGTGYCCDQVTLYDPNSGRVFWLLQYGDHLALANSSAASLFTSWCYYNITPSWFGQPATTGIDYNDLALSAHDIYIASNLFPSAGGQGSGVIRLPIAPMTTCSGFGYNYLSRMDTFTFKPVAGAGTTMYWGTNWFSDTSKNGSVFRVYRWDEGSGYYSWVDRSIAPFNFEYRNRGQTCGSADGVVNNWCQFADSRVLGGYRANNVIGFSFNAKQGSGYPFPYTRRVYFRESDLAYTQSSSFWGSWGALQFMQLSPNARGAIGGTFVFGGGTGSSHWYPGAGVLIDDDVTPYQPWSYRYYLFGSGNTCVYNSLYRWGDYLAVRQFQPAIAGNAWVATGYAIKGANCGTRGWYAEPHNVVFGRGREYRNVVAGMQR